MKIVANTKELQKITSIASPFVSKFFTTPELACFVLKVDHGILSIKGSDGEKQIEAKMMVEGDEGEIMVEAAQFSSMIQTFSGETCTIEFDGKTVTMKSLKDRFGLRTIEGRWFGVPEAQSDHKCELPCLQLIEGISKVMFLTPAKHINTALTGVLLHIKDGLNIVSSDGLRMAASFVKGEFGEERSAIIPKSSLVPIIAVLESLGENVEILLERNKATFIGQNCVVSTILMQGDFVPYQNVLGVNIDHSVELGSKDLEAALKKIAIIDLMEKNFEIDININETTAFVMAKNKISAVESELEVKSDASLQIKVDSRFLYNVTKFTGENTVVFRVNKQLGFVLVYNLDKSNIYAFKAVSIE